MELDSILLYYFYLIFVLKINQVFIFYQQILNKNEIFMKTKSLSCIRQLLQSFFDNIFMNLNSHDLI
ncbi:hypothetical protein H8356DRAFT_1693049 [Neocallimastix lanati (nom. inval.)]|uniref:Uncharacterized protein n=1 Tax=Neocallimastix californiae TaxID=1754190 RepID=A0A1Y2AG88_9FUNG|nr:hypothetical protein H8356DRAFT_1693049 [Neocallimastix sp. JGI-2020a]ORY21492.1 hypothetical protein LY90DRAFT_707439 [Neocallimastix californiae]|eukprot:ORY21492.1 hypothetical protein LY90DRAFT_707439 [Neocallimastix californiae]